jgi:hypothetical protein
MIEGAGGEEGSFLGKEGGFVAGSEQLIFTG